MTKAPENSLKSKKSLGWLTFIFGIVTAAAFFVPYIVSGNGYFIFFGDFNVQQIPFYQHCHEMVRSGDFFGWDWQTDLGSNFIGSYTFYLLGSPFFWLTLLFPNSFVPYLMGPLLILKFGCAALTGYIFIRRFTSRPESAMAGGLMYAFSGFSVYNIFFNHFHEAIIVFPLLLWAIEKFMAERSRGYVIFAVFLSVLTNYFFFFGMVVFVVIYWLVRTLSQSFRINFKEFALLALECVLGLCLSAVILLPTVLEVLQNNRLSSIMNGWGAVLYGKEQIFLNVIQCFFFPPDLPARPVFFPEADVKWSSLGGWLPLFGMTGVIAWLQSNKKGTWLRRVLGISIFMALVPGLNAVFSMLNTAYYARWYFMPILLMCLATSVAFEDSEVNWNSAWRWNFGITSAFIAVIGFLPTIDGNGNITKWGLYTDSATNPVKYIWQTVKHAIDGVTVVEGDTYDLRFWVTVAIAFFSSLAVRALIPMIKERKTSVFKPIVALVCIVSILYSAFFISCGQAHSYEMDSVMTDALIEGEVSIADEDEFFRVDVYDGVDNTGLYLGLSSINYFHSIVPASLVDFYEYVGISRSVATRPEASYHSLRSLLSVKYMLDPEIENSKEFLEEDGETAIPGYALHSAESGYDIYLNKNYIPMGFTYDYYIDKETMAEYSDERRVDLMLKALYLEDKDIPTLSKYLTDITTEYRLGKSPVGTKTVFFDEKELERDSFERREVAAHSFKTSSKGFTAHISMDRENLVFFSVPYHEGFTATVNGQKTQIYKVNQGFMAVVAPEGLCEIKFTFTTPGLKVGLIVTLVTVVLIAIYIGIIIIKRNFKPAPEPDYPEGDVIAEHCRIYEAEVYAAENPEDDYLLENLSGQNLQAYSGFNGGFVIDDSAFDDEPDIVDIPPLETWDDIKSNSAPDDENKN